jgi:hypothetical protein
MIRTFAFLLAVLLVPVGTALVGSENGLSGYWVGKHSDELVNSWGEPGKIKKRSGGIRVFVYKLRFHSEREVDAPGWYLDERSQPQDPSAPPRSHPTPIIVPAAIIPGPVDTKEVKTKGRVQFFIDHHGYVYKVRSR